MNAIQATDEIFDPFVLIHQSVTARLQIVEAELETAEAKSRELEASLEQVRDQAEESRVVEKHLLNNLKQFSPSEVQETFANIRETQLSVDRVQLEYEFLTARRAELKDQGQFLRSASQILADLQRMYGENGSPATAAEGDKQFRDASRQVFQIIEEERMRIARDMHDGPAQSMANLVLQAEILERLLDRNPKQLVTELAEFKNSVRNALEETRQLIFDLSGDQGGKWWIKIADGKAESGKGDAPEPANLTLMADSHDWVNIMTGKLDGTAAFMQGKLKIKGDMGLAIKMQSLFRRPS